MSNAEPNEDQGSTEDQRDPQEVLDEFAKNFVDSQQDLGPEFRQVLEDNFWELLS